MALIRLAAGLSLALAFLATPAAAEMYRCKGPDGRTLYTSDQSQCPGARKHEPAGRVQAVTTPARAPATSEAAAPGAPHSPARAAAAAAMSGDAQAAGWRRKKREAQAEQSSVAERLPYVERALRFCNRGNKLYTEDVDGMRQTYSCEKVEAEAEQLSRRSRELAEYLDQGGLEEACRRAGCLPGWIRD